jgi:hypothetical protein
MRLSQLTLVCLSLLALNGCAMSTAPVVNYYHGEDSCGLVCYSHNPEGIYKLSSQPYLEGVIMVQGKYDKHICKPTGYENKDISTTTKFAELCDAQIKGCENAKATTGKGCWVGADSGNLTVMPK